MGSLFSKSKKQANFGDVDANGDGKITRGEFDDWTFRLENKIVRLEENHINRVDEIRQEIGAKDRVIAEKDSEIIELKTTLQEMERRLEISQSTLSDVRAELLPLQQTEKPKSLVSKDKILTFVDSLLENPDTNFKYIPDVIERQAHAKIYTQILGEVAGILDNTNIEIVGHKLRITMEPTE